MATGGSDLLTKLCEGLLSCDICSEDFDHDSHSPRILPCYHSFCGTCLEKLTKDGNVECPKCRRVARVSGKFPMDTTRIALLDKKRALQSQEGVSCEGCTEGAKATSRCQDCEEFLCEDCCAAHRKLKVYKDHTVIPLAEAMKNPGKLLQSIEKCNRHSDEKVKLFCISCSTTVCATCAVTTHKKCEKVVELDSILDDKKKEMLSLCEELDKVEKSFQAKAEESEASLKAVQSNLKKAVQEVEGVFSEIISSATERQAEVIGELRARAKSDGLLLEEQAATFRSLQAAAHTSAQYGRTCVSLSLAAQVIGHTPELQKTIEDLREKNVAEVKSPNCYKVSTEKLEELQALLREICSVGNSSVSTGVSMGDLPIALPSIQLDSSRCGAGCQVGADGRSLSNQPCPQRKSPLKKGQRFRFQGTCSTAAMPGRSCYWQVQCVARPKPKIQDKEGLCEFGVATQRALQACPGDRGLSQTGHCAMTAWLFTGEGQVKVGAMYKNHVFSATDLAPSSPSSPVSLTLGLLLDAAASRLHVIDVRATRVLCSSDIDLSSPVWPVVRVWSQKHNGAGVSVEVQSGRRQVEMTAGLARLLQSLLGSDSQ